MMMRILLIHAQASGFDLGGNAMRVLLPRAYFVALLM